MPLAMKDHIKNPDDMHVPHPDHVPIPTDRAMMDARKINPMDAAHVMDFGNLALGHPDASHKNVWLVDLAVNVYGLEEIKDSNRPISVVVSCAVYFSPWSLAPFSLLPPADARCSRTGGRTRPSRWPRWPPASSASPSASRARAAAR